MTGKEIVNEIADFFWFVKASVKGELNHNGALRLQLLLNK